MIQPINDGPLFGPHFNTPRGDRAAGDQTMATTTTTACRQTAAGHSPRIEPERVRLCEDNHAEFLAGEPCLEILVGLMPSRRGAYAHSPVELSEYGRQLGRLVIRYKRRDEGSGESQRRIGDALRSLFRSGKLERLTVDKLANLLVAELRGETGAGTGGTLKNRDRAMHDVERAMRRDVDHLAEITGHDHGEPLSIDKAIEAIGPATLLNAVMSSLSAVRAVQQRYEFREELEARGEWEPRERALMAERIGMARKHFGPYLVAWVAEQLGSLKPTTGSANIARRVDRNQPAMAVVA